MSNEDQVRAHIETLHSMADGIDGKLVLASFGQNPETGKTLSPKIQHFNIGDVDGMVKTALELAQEEHRNVYTPLAVMRPDLPAGQKGEEKDVVAALGLNADFDKGTGADYLNRCPVKPSYALETSPNNVQAIFFLDTPLPTVSEDDRRTAKTIAKQLTRACEGADSVGADLSHVWRIPGLPNYPNQKKVQEGRDPAPFEVTVKQPYQNERVSPLKLLVALPSVTQEKEYVSADVEYIKTVDLKDLSPEMAFDIEKGAPNGQRSELVYKVTCQLLDFGYGTGDIIDVIYAHPHGVGERFNGDKKRIEDDVLRMAGKKRQEADGQTTEEEENRKPFVVEPFEPFDVKELAQRSFIFGSYLIRKMLSLLIAPPGVGKSNLSLSMAVSVVTGKNILGIPVHERGNVAVINNEDDMDEMRRRLAGILQQHDIKQDELEGKLFLHSGETYPFQIAKYDAKAQALLEHHKCDLTNNLIENNVSLLIVDPFLETHEGNENDNREMSQVCTWYRKIAQQANCALLIVHHTRKEDGKSSGGHAGNQDSGRGASAISGVARVVFTLYNMDKDAAKKLGVPEKRKHEYIRLDDAKANLSKISGETKWFKRESVTIANGDSVGVLLPVQLEEKTDNHELELVAAVCKAPAFEEIRQRVDDDIPRGRFIKAMMDCGAYLGDTTKTRSTIESRMEKVLMDEGITHHGCTIKMIKKSGHYNVQIKLPEPETTDIADLPDALKSIIGNRENSIVFGDMPQLA